MATPASSRSLSDQSDTFETWLKARYPGIVPHQAYGASNAPFVMPNGFRLGLFNIDKSPALRQPNPQVPFALATRVLIPPKNALHIALVFEPAQIAAVTARRDQIRTDVGNANKVRAYIHQGNVYFRQAEDEEVINVAGGSYGPPLTPTRLYFADTESTYHLTPLEVNYVNYLRTLLPGIPVSRLGPTETAGGEALDPKSISPAELASRVRALGGFYPDQVIFRYHAALNHLSHKHFALLTGISGTGKTLLAKAYAYAILGVPSIEATTEDFILIPVKPDWADTTQLLGYYDAISGSYRSTLFTQALRRAHANPHRPVFLCIDEMNLAQPEHYFADVLSAMETRGPIHLHTMDPDQARIPQEIPWPTNLFITGTVNVDETTRTFSPRLLDRSNVIDLSDHIDVSPFLEGLRNEDARFKSVLSVDVEKVLTALDSHLRPHGLHFGYRVLREIGEYLAFCEGAKILASEAMDRQIEQKILTKVRGGPELDSALMELEMALEGQPTSRAVVKRLRRQLAEVDSCEYWR